MTTAKQTAVTIGFAVALAACAYGHLSAALSGSEAPSIALFALALVAGVVIKRWGALLALLGPFLAMVALEATGYVTPAYLEWGDRPLASAPGIFLLILLAMTLALGIGLGWLAHQILRPMRGRSDREASPVSPHD
jgi:hypothetical protein